MRTIAAEHCIHLSMQSCPRQIALSADEKTESGSGSRAPAALTFRCFRYAFAILIQRGAAYVGPHFLFTDTLAKFFASGGLSPLPRC